MEALIPPVESDQFVSTAQIRDRARTPVAPLQGLTAPINTLPVELLVEIFMRTIRTSHHYPPLHIQDAFRISHICSYWREVAIGTPTLWAGPIEIHCHCDSTDLVDDYADGLRTWLARSTPLAIPLSLKCMESGRCSDINPRIMDEMLRIAPRWRALRLLLSVQASSVSRLAESSLASLEELEIINILGVSEFDPATISSFSIGAPRLRKLKMPTACQIPMPWTQLTQLVLTDLGSPHISLDILAQCLDLETASVCARAWSIPPPPRADMLGLNRLRALTLRLVASGTDPLDPFQNPLTSFLDRISAPALDDICIDFSCSYTQGMPWAEARFTAFQRRSPKITRLEIGWAGLTSNDLCAALRHAPSLTRLKLIYCRECIDDTLLHALSYKDDAENLVPSLRELVIEKMNRFGFTPDILASMIASRWWTDAELESRSAPPAVTRWTLVELKGLSLASNLRLDQQFTGRIEDLLRQALPFQV